MDVAKLADFLEISLNVYNVFEKCVDLAAESPTGQRLLDELFLDRLKSE